jgi:hypothetical protein
MSTGSKQPNKDQTDRLLNEAEEHLDRLLSDPFLGKFFEPPPEEIANVDTIDDAQEASTSL